jgi:2-iminobutanoate/2-iminopropanoate deaminase/2-aminomuconate deaminase
MLNIHEVHPQPDRAAEMPYAPAIEVTGAGQIVFISGATASPLYHQHPHVKKEHVLPDDIEVQTRRAMETIQMVLDAKDLSWRNVAKVTKYLTDIREMDAVNRTMQEYLGDHRPASTLLCVNNLSSPGARVELDMIAVGSSEPPGSL